METIVLLIAIFKIRSLMKRHLYKRMLNNVAFGLHATLFIAWTLLSALLYIKALEALADGASFH